MILYRVYDREMMKYYGYESDEDLYVWVRRNLVCTDYWGKRHLDISIIDFTGRDRDKDNYLKRYVILDNCNRILNIRDNIDVIFATSPLYEWQRKYKRSADKEIGETYLKYSWCSKHTGVYRFRVGSVPGIHCEKWHRGSHYRHVRFIRNCKLAEQYPNTIRHKGYKDWRKFWYDDMPYKSTIRSWKNQTKCKHQWEKNINRYAV